MSALTFPPHPTRQNYVVTPWIAPDGEKWIWSQIKLSWSNNSLPVYLALTAVPLSGTTPIPAITFIGQTAIVSHADGIFTEWGAVSLTQWLPRTAGVLMNTDTGLYERVVITAGSFISIPLPI